MKQKLLARLLLVTAVMLSGLNYSNAQCPVVAPWTEPFTTTVNPACWTQSATSGGPWTYTGNPGYDVAGTLDHTNGVTNNYAWIDFSGTDAGVILTSPEIDVTALTVPELRFWEISHYVSGTLTPFNFLHLEAWDGAAWQLVTTYQGETGAAWVEHTVILSPWIYNTNFVQFRFRAESGGSASDFYNDLLIDDVSVIEAPTCPAPVSLVLDSADLTTGSISWTPTGGETEWIVEYGAPGFTPGTGSSFFTTNPWGTTPALASNDFYCAYVRAVCSPGDTSFYTGPVCFNTYNQPLYMDEEPVCPAAGFIDISGTGISNNLTDDGEVGVTMPFSLLYQGMLVDELTIGNNGGIALGTLTAQIGLGGIVGAGTADGLYPFWDDLDSETGSIYVEVIGTSPNQVLIIQYEQRPHFSGVVGQNITFQVQIEEATNEIYFVYEDVEFGGSQAAMDYALSAGIGIAGPNQDIATSSNDATYLQNNTCAHYYYTNCPAPTNFAVTYTTENEGAVTWGSGLAGETDWTVIYGPAGFDPGQSGTSVSTSTPALIMPGLDDLTCYDVYIYADCSPILQSNGYMGTFCTLPNCANPSAILTSTAVDTVMTSWSWVENVGYPSTGFGIQYGWTGFTPGTGTVAYLDNNYTDTTEDMTLMGGGVYEMYVQAVCGTDSSAWTGPISFTMPLTNDSTCFAEDLAVDGTMYTFNNGGATIDAGEGTIAPPATGFQTQDGWGNSNINLTVWYTFTAPPSGNVRVNCAGLNFDGQVAAYEVTDCNDFSTYTLVGANDDGPNFVNPPLMNLCGLTPGAQYYLVYDSYSTVATGTYNMTLTDVNVEAGTDNGLSDICLGDTIDLYTNISGNDAGGVWSEMIPTANFNDPYFLSAGLASQVFDFEYVVVDGCATDTVATSVEIYAPSSAGIDGTIDACMNQPIDLYAGLSGNVDMNGSWYDPSNSLLGSSAISASSIPGQFNYDYVTGNGVCPDDTANVIVDVDFNCDYLNLQELYFNAMDIHPNPTTGMVYISNNGSDEVFNLELTDLNGKIISTQNGTINGTETTEVSLDKLETGVYLIRVFNDNVEKTFRIVK